MPNPDLRERNANPNDPYNVHTTRAQNGAYLPPERSGGGAGGFVVAIVAVIAIAAIGYFVMADGESTRLAEGPAPVIEGDNNTPTINIEPTVEEDADTAPETDGGAATEETAPVEEPAAGGSTEGTN